MNADKFLDLIESRQLLEPSLIGDLRQQIRELGEQVKPEAVSALLVDNGYLTPYQAKKLLGELSALGGSPGAAAPEAPKPPQHQSPEEVDLALPDQEAEGGEDVVILEAGESQPGFQAWTEDEDAPIDLAKVDLETPASAKSGGGADDLFGDDISPLMGAPPRRRGLMTRVTKTSQWDTKLILGGSALLLLLLIAFAFLYVSLTRGTAAEMFEAAEQDYRDLAYTQSIAKYDRFLDKYPDDPNASLARVRRGTARMRAVVDGDPQQALKVARDVLPEIENEEAFPEARPELASMLPTIAENFTARAKQAALRGDMETAEQQVELADLAMDLVNNPAYIPTTLRKSQEARIERILEDATLVRRDINRDKELQETVALIDDDLQARDPDAAYQRLDELLDKYPGLQSHEAVGEASLRIAQKQQELVEVVTQPIAALTEPPQQPSDAQAILADVQGDAAGRPPEETVFVLAGGAVFGVQVDTGEVRWRYFVGSETTEQPLPLGQAGDALLVDAQRQELTRVQGQRGTVSWRLPVGERFATSAVAEASIFVSTASGRLLAVDSRSGESPRHAVLPQPLQVAAAVSEAAPYLYQASEHSNIYVLSKETLECEEVFYLGHKNQTLDVAPVVNLGHLLVAENAGSDYSYLHVLATNKEGLELRRPQEPFRLNGRVLVPPVVFGRRVLVATDLGSLYIFDVDPAVSRQPVTIVAQQTAPANRPMIRYPAVERDQLWVGDYRLTKYQIQFSRGQLAREWVKADGEPYVGPLHVFGEVLVQVRAARGSQGVTVSALRTDDAEVIWHADLAVPAAHVGASAVPQLRAISQRGALFQLSAESLTDGQAVVHATAGAQAASSGIREVVELEDGRLAFLSAAHPPQLLVYDQPAAGPARAVSLPLDGKALVTTAPQAFAGGLLVPVRLGQVWLLDVESGRSNVLPFQPPLPGGAEVYWRSPAVVGRDGSSFLVVDQSGSLFRVGIKQEPQPHLAQLASTSIAGAPLGPLAVAGETLYAVLETAEGDQVTAFAMADLSPSDQWPLDGPLRLGPQRVGEVVLVGTDRTLMCFEDGSKLRWQLPLTDTPAGLPLAQADGFWLATVQGRLWKAAAEDGKELHAHHLGEPLAGGPALLGNRLVVPGGDGTLHFVSIP